MRSLTPRRRKALPKFCKRVHRMVLQGALSSSRAKNILDRLAENLAKEADTQRLISVVDATYMRIERAR